MKPIWSHTCDACKYIFTVHTSDRLYDAYVHLNQDGPDEVGVVWGTPTQDPELGCANFRPASELKLVTHEALGNLSIELVIQNWAYYTYLQEELRHENSAQR